MITWLHDVLIYPMQIFIALIIVPFTDFLTFLNHICSLLQVSRLFNIPQMDWKVWVNYVMGSFDTLGWHKMVTTLQITFSKVIFVLLLLNCCILIKFFKPKSPTDNKSPLVPNRQQAIMYANLLTQLLLYIYGSQIITWLAWLALWWFPQMYEKSCIDLHNVQKFEKSSKIQSFAYLAIVMMKLRK